MFNQTCSACQGRAGWWKEEQEAGAGNANYAERGSTCSSPLRTAQAPGLGKGSSPGPGLEQEEKPLPGVFSTAGVWRGPGAVGEGKERQQAEDWDAERLHSTPMQCKSPPPQSPGEARRGAPRPARAATAAPQWLRWEARLPPSRSGSSSLPLQSPGVTGSGSSAAPFSPALPRQGEETPWLPYCSSEPAAPAGQGLFPLLPQPARGTCSAPGTVLPLPHGVHHVLLLRQWPRRAYPCFGSSPDLQPAANSTASAEETASCSS